MTLKDHRSPAEQRADRWREWRALVDLPAVRLVLFVVGLALRGLLIVCA